VETFEQVASLRDAGISLGQGHLFGRAVPADVLDERLRATIS
jgi:EAL domain-containing protein (putative c-di-GMP-specific phosphodiesterase class I)